jgi:hypothetical protein
MANELNRRFVARLRLAGTLVIVGLGIQMVTLLEAHPYSFLSFLVGGTAFIVAGVVAFVWAWLAQ